MSSSSDQKHIGGLVGGGGGGGGGGRGGNETCKYGNCAVENSKYYLELYTLYNLQAVAWITVRVPSAS